MNDRELLELAAKAAGVSGVWVERLAADGYPCDFVGIGRASTTIAPLWNPLTDRGDALQLSVTLGIDVRHDRDNLLVEATHEDLEGWGVWELYEDDPVAATCLAITRCAAEIGKRMP